MKTKLPPVGKPSIRDDNGVWWIMSNRGNLQCVGDNDPDGGYYCGDIDFAKEVLDREGYIERKEG